MKPRLLVVSSVHPADDPRIRYKLIRTLEDEWEITYATRSPAPTDHKGVRWIHLVGGRLRRDWKAARLLLRGDYAAATLHDPELLPAGIIAGLRGRRVVFDLHENLPAQIGSKAWIPGPLRQPVSWIARRTLRLAEKTILITLAEPGYRDLLKQSHVVFPNYPLDIAAPGPRSRHEGIVYLGDVTENRGLEVAVRAIGQCEARPKLTLVGRVSAAFRARLESVAAAGGVAVEFLGYVDHEKAKRIVTESRLALSPLLDRPNYRHSLPTKVLEYLAVGIPVVASDLPGTTEAIGGLPGVLLVPAGDVRAWSVAIDQALEDEELQSAAARGAAAVRDRYAWPVAEVRGFYRGLLA